MNRFRRVICLLLCMVLTTFVLAACGSDEPGETTPEGTGQTDVKPTTGLRLSETEVTLTQGEKGKTLKAYSIATGKEVITVTWESEDESVVQVNPYGELTAVDVGSTTVRATNISDHTEAACSVTVVAKAEGITLDETEVTIMVAGDYQIRAQMNPSSLESRFTYQSSDPSVASVSQDGKVTGLKSGTTRILVTAVNSRYTATCTVKVCDYVTEVVMEEKNITMNVGETDRKLSYTLLPADALPTSVKWTSSDPSVVSVDENGKLSALKAGSADITVTLGNGTSQGISKSVKVEVFAEAATIALSQRSLSLDLNQTHQLSATVTPDNDVTLIWTSANPAIASVSSSGEVRALKIGKTTITVMTADGTATATCEVSVGGDIGIKFEQSQMTLTMGNSVTLTPIFTPEGYSEELKWTSSNLQIVNVDQKGAVTAKGVGTATVTATGKSSGKSASVSITVEKSVLNVKITEIRVKSKIVNVNVGEYAKFELELVPENANEAYSYRVISGNGVRVTEEGVFAVREGLATVAAVSASGVQSDVIIVQIQPITNAVKQNATKEYNELVSAETKLNKQNLSDIDKKYDSEITPYQSLLEKSGLTSEAVYNQKKAGYEEQLEAQRALLEEAEAAEDTEAAEAARKKIDELNESLRKLETDWDTAKVILSMLNPILEAKQKEVDAETARHEAVMKEINEKYDFLLPYLN